MTHLVQQMAPVIWEEITKAKNILLHFHPSPDPDSIGCALAMYHMLRKAGKKVTVISGDSEIPAYIDIFPGYQSIVQSDISQIDLSRFDLFVILDSSDYKLISRKNEVVFPENLRTVIIDHHATNSSFGDVNLVDPSYQSTCEILFELFKLWNIDLDYNISTNLYLGIYSDTRGFKNPKTSSETFAKVTELTKISTDFPEKVFILENQRKHDDLKLMGLAYSSIQNYFSDKVAIAQVNYSQLEKNQVSRPNAKAQIADVMKSVKGWMISIVLVEEQPGIVICVIRTRDSKVYPVDILAKSIGGGGHAHAAAGNIDGNIDQVRLKLLESLVNIYPSLGSI